MYKKIMFPSVNGLVYGGDYNPDQWLDRPDILKKDIELMKKAHINTVTLGVFSWSALEKEEGVYSFDWLIDIINDLYANGIHTILATPSGGKPAWLDQKYEEVRRCDAYGVREYRKERHNFCPSSPVFIDKITKLDRMLAQRVKDNPAVILWHISNEFEGECYCPLCTKKFRSFLRKKYHGDINELNHEWWTSFWSKRFNDFEQIEPPYKNGEESLMGLNLDWRRFTSTNFAEYMDKEIAAVREVIPNALFTTNMMMFFPLLDYRQFAKRIDVLSWDAYPQLHNDYETMFDTFQEAGFTHALMRSMKKQPFMLMESTPSKVNWRQFNKAKRPGVHKLSCLHALANGSDTVQYFQIRASRGGHEMFHSAVIGHDGRDDTRIFKDVEDVGAMMESISEIKGSVQRSEVAIIVDWDTRWALWTAKAFNAGDKKYEKTVQAFYKQLQRNGIDTDIISQFDDLSQYKLVFAPMMFLLEDGTADKIREYVRNGGVVVSTYATGYVNKNQLALLGGFPGDGLKEVFGIESEEIDVLWPSQTNTFEYQNKTVEAFDYCDVLRLEGAEKIASYTSDFYEGSAAITLNRYGQGKAYYLAARFDLKELNDLFIDLYKEAGVSYQLLPENVEYHERYLGDNCYAFYLNESDATVCLSEVYGFDLLSDRDLKGDVSLGAYECLVIKK